MNAELPLPKNWEHNSEKPPTLDCDITPLNPLDCIHIRGLSISMNQTIRTHINFKTDDNHPVTARIHIRADLAGHHKGLNPGSCNCNSTPLPLS